MTDPITCLRSVGLTEFFTCVLVLALTGAASIAQDGKSTGDVPVSPTVSAVVKPLAEGNGATGTSSVSGNTYRGDVMEVLQKLNDEIATDNGGDGGKIVLKNGTYVTDVGLTLGNGVHLVAESRHGPVIHLKEGASVKQNGYTFVTARGTNIVVDGIAFRANRATEQVRTELTRDASSGDKTLHVKDAGPFEGRGKSIGMGRPGRNQPGGMQLRDSEHSERIMIKSVNTKENTLDLKWGGVRNRYARDRGAGIVFYPSVQGVTISGENYIVRNCKFVNL